MSAEFIPCFVGVDTSNYTTSVAVATLDEGGKFHVVANLKYPLPVKEGERGLRQSDAVFAHVKNLPNAMTDLQKILSLGAYRVCSVGYSATPTDREGSYMPCFLTGKVAATALVTGLASGSREVCIYPFSHQSGHITAALYSADLLQNSDILASDILAFHVSGGTTDVLRVKWQANGYEMSIQNVGEGADLHAGQVIDRVGVMMGLNFPCGKEMEMLAQAYLADNPPIKGLKVSVIDGVCHLSGLENMAEKLWRETGDKGHVSAFVLSFIGKTLRRMTEQIQARYFETGGFPVVYAGGVMSNKLIRPMLTEGTDWQTYFAEPAYSADNAAGVALLCGLRWRAER